jgi:multidrug transporter EmrE-like cation transporter
LKFHPIAIVGLLIVIAGIAGLFHPQLMLPGQSREIQIGNQKAIITQHRVLEFPKAFCIILIVCGAVQIYLVRRR